MTAQTQEELLAAHLEQQKIHHDEPVVEDEDEDEDDDDDLEGGLDASGRSEAKRRAEKLEDLSSQLQSQAAEQFKVPDLSSVISKPETSAVGHDDEDVDEPKDIDLVMTQAGVSRSKAVRSLNS